MKILFASGHPYLPQLRGGIQTTMNELATALIGDGHEVALLTGLSGSGWVGLRSRLILLKGLGPKAATDHIMGYPVHRAWFAWEAARDVLAKEKPDVVVIHGGGTVRMALAFQGHGVPVVVYLHDLEHHLHGGDFADLRVSGFIANSQFTAEGYRAAFGIESTVIPPLIDPETYRTTSARTHVTFINPHPQKGLDIALHVAKACPTIPFLFVESWQLAAAARADLVAALAELPNVTLLSARSGMLSVYARTKILLVPSRWQEAWGRVACEAQLSGIPVIASRRGGLPEAVGPGGMLIDPDGPLDAWVEAVRAQWFDEKLYDGLSRAALVHSQRPDGDRRHLLSEFMRVMRSAVSPQSPQLVARPHARVSEGAAAGGR